MLKHYLIINGLEVQINEPLGFNEVEFSIVQDKEYHGRNNTFAGGSDAELTLNNSHHENVFNDVLNEYRSNGGNAEMYYLLYYNNSLMYKLRVDCSLAITDLVTYFTFTCIEDNILKDLDYNSDVKIDVNSNENINKDYSDRVRLERTYIGAVPLILNSEWRDERGGYNLVGRSSFTWLGLQQVVKSDINDTLTNMDWSMGENNSESWNKCRLLRCRTNLKNTVAKISLNNSSIRFENRGDMSVVLAWGRDRYEGENYNDWWNSIEKFEAFRVTNVSNSQVTGDWTTGIGSLNRGDCVWLIYTSSATSHYTNDNNKLELSAYSIDYGSVVNTSRYRDVIDNLTSKITGTKNEYFNDVFNNRAFSGSAFRGLDDSKFLITWKDVKEQLKELSLGYELIDNKLHFKDFKDFYKDEEIVKMISPQKLNEFEVKQDIRYHINTINYAYKKYQSKKENEQEGNALTVNGESQWKVYNKFTDTELKIDVPFIRDQYMIEYLRAKELRNMDNTATNDDEDVFLAQMERESSVTIEDTSRLRFSYDNESNRQMVANEREFDWGKLGVRQNDLISFDVDGWKEFIVFSVSENILYMVALNGTINKTGLFRFRVNIQVGFKSSVNMFDNYSIKQNMLKSNYYLSVFNYFTRKDIVITDYKGDKDRNINGVVESENITYSDPIITPFEYNILIEDSISKFGYINANKNGYITVIDSLGEQIALYIKELHITFIDCDRAQYKIIGMLKN